eukprot:scaffold28530_cov66-Cyclotella_meneghiniana.AAC.2
MDHVLLMGDHGGVMSYGLNGCSENSTFSYAVNSNKEKESELKERPIRLPVDIPSKKDSLLLQTVCGG